MWENCFSRRRFTTCTGWRIRYRARWSSGCSIGTCSIAASAYRNSRGAAAPPAVKCRTCPPRRSNLFYSDLLVFEIALVLFDRLVHLHEADAGGGTDRQRREAEINAVVAHHVFGVVARRANLRARIARISRERVARLPGRANRALAQLTGRAARVIHQFARRAHGLVFELAGGTQRAVLHLADAVTQFAGFLPRRLDGDGRAADRLLLDHIACGRIAVARNAARNVARRTLGIVRIDIDLAHAGAPEQRRETGADKQRRDRRLLPQFPGNTGANRRHSDGIVGGPAFNVRDEAVDRVRQLLLGGIDHLVLVFGGVSDELVFHRADRRRLQLRDAVDESGSRRLDIALQCVDFTHVAISRDFADAAARAGAAALSLRGRTLAGFAAADGAAAACRDIGEGLDDVLCNTAQIFRCEARAFLDRVLQPLGRFAGGVAELVDFLPRGFTRELRDSVARFAHQAIFLRRRRNDGAERRAGSKSDGGEQQRLIFEDEAHTGLRRRARRLGKLLRCFAHRALCVIGEAGKRIGGGASELAGLIAEPAHLLAHAGRDIARGLRHRRQITLRDFAYRGSGAARRVAIRRTHAG